MYTCIVQLTIDINTYTDWGLPNASLYKCWQTLLLKVPSTTTTTTTTIEGCLITKTNRTERQPESWRETTPPSPPTATTTTVAAVASAATPTTTSVCGDETNFTISNFLFIQYFHSARHLECHVYFFISLIIYSYSIVELNCLHCWNVKQSRRIEATTTTTTAFSCNYFRFHLFWWVGFPFFFVLLVLLF